MMKTFVALCIIVGSIGCFHVRPTPVPDPPAPVPVPTPLPDLPPSSYRLQVYVQDTQDQPLILAQVYRDNVPGEREAPVPVDADAGKAWDLPPSDFNVCGKAEGYDTTCAPVALHGNITVTIHLPLVPVDIAPALWPPTAQAPITQFPPLIEDGRPVGYWSHDPYAQGLAFDPLDIPTPDYIRGNFGPIDFTECNLPVVAGGYTDRPWLVMSWLLPEYSVAQQVCILKGHQARGYTHFNTYLPFSVNQGVTDDAFLESLARVHRAGFWNIVTLFGGDGETWEGRIEPFLVKALASGAIQAGDTFVVCWQCSGKMDPFPLAELTVRVATWAHAHGMFSALHWYSGTIAWWNATDDTRRPSTCYDAPQIGLVNFCDRFQYGHAMAEVVDFQFQQFDPWAPIEDTRPREGGIAGELRDSLRAIFGRTKLVVSEYDAQRREDQNVPEIEGDTKGFLLLSIKDVQGRAATGGFLGGARMPDGSYVH